MRNTKGAVCTSGQKRARAFKALLLDICVVASMGQLAYTVLCVSPHRSTASFIGSEVLGISLVVQFVLLTTLLVLLVSRAIGKTKYDQWVLQGAILLWLQALLLGIQLYQVSSLPSMVINTPERE